MNEKLLKLKEEIKATRIVEGKTNETFMDKDVVIMLGPDAIAVARKKVYDGTFEENKISIDKVIKVNFVPGSFFFHTRRGVFMCPIYADENELRAYCKEFKHLKNLESTKEEFDIFTYEPTGQIPKITDELVDQILENAKKFYEKKEAEPAPLSNQVSRTREFKRLVDDINKPYDADRLDLENSYAEEYKPMHAMYKEPEIKETETLKMMNSLTPEAEAMYEETIKELAEDEKLCDCAECNAEEAREDAAEAETSTCECGAECTCEEDKCTCGDDCECEKCKPEKAEETEEPQEGTTNFFDENVPDSDLSEEEKKELEQKIQETKERIEEVKKKGKRRSGWKIFFIILLLLALAGAGLVYAVNYSGLELPFEFDLGPIETFLANTYERGKEVIEGITKK